jgi:glycosyltransferase involved in cell wall biosynthesis
MRIGFDAKRIFQNATGLGNYSRSVVKNLAEKYPENEYVLFTPNARNVLPFPSKNENVKTVVGRGSVWRSFGIRRDIVRNKIDVYHGLSNELPFSINKTDAKSVVTIHDLIFEHFPHHYPGVDRTLYDVKSKFAVNHADIIVAASESTKRDIVDYYKVTPDKIHVVYQSCDDVFYDEHNADLSNYHLPSEFMLYVGSVTERKNLLAVCKAYLLIPDAQKIPCVIIGNGKRYAEEVKTFIAEHHLQHWFIFLENIPTLELPAFYRKASCFIYPSLYEGFGIPILEAMVCNCPVITSGVSSLPEVGGDAAAYVNPASPEEIAIQILNVLTNSEMRAAMISRGKSRLPIFDKFSLAEKMMALYQLK